MYIERINYILRTVLDYKFEVRVHNSVLDSLLRVAQSLEDSVNIQLVFKLQTALLEEGAKSFNLG